MRFNKFFSTLLLTFVCMCSSFTFAQGLLYRSNRGNTVRIELRDKPTFHAIVYEPTYGAIRFENVAADKDGALFKNDQVNMQLFLTRDIQKALFVSPTDKELYIIDNGYSAPSASISTDFSSPSASERPKTCYTCHGMLSCPVCHGSGRGVSYNGNTPPICGACHGSGKCYHCNGTGRQ